MEWKLFNQTIDEIAVEQGNITKKIHTICSISFLKPELKWSRQLPDHHWKAGSQDPHTLLQ